MKRPFCGTVTRSMRLITVVLSIAASSTAISQEHQHPPEDQEIHEKFYSTWIRPDIPEYGSCCNNEDCYPTEFKKEGSDWYARRRQDGAWIRIPPEKFEHNRVDGLPRDNPDGRNHVCMNAHGDVFCAILGGGI